MTNIASKSSAGFAQIYGPESSIFTEVIDKIDDKIDNSEIIKSDYNEWRTFADSYLGLIEEGEFKPDIDTEQDIKNDRYLYSCRIYSGLVLDALLQKIDCGDKTNKLTEGVPLHSWVLQNRTVLEEQRDLIRECFSKDLISARENHIDPLRDLLTEIIPEEVRHTLGAVYTPDWLVERTLDRLEPDYSEGSFLDPACGTGVFLLKTINELSEKGFSASEIIDRVVGVEISPMDTIIARTTFGYSMTLNCQQMLIIFQYSILILCLVLILHQRRASKHSPPSLNPNQQSLFIQIPTIKS
jgi:hypothetical protein